MSGEEEDDDMMSMDTTNDREEVELRIAELLRRVEDCKDPATGEISVPRIVELVGLNIIHPENRLEWSNPMDEHGEKKTGKSAIDAASNNFFRTVLGLSNDLSRYDPRLQKFFLNVRHMGFSASFECTNPETAAHIDRLFLFQNKIAQVLTGFYDLELCCDERSYAERRKNNKLEDTSRRFVTGMSRTLAFTEDTKWSDWQMVQCALTQIITEENYKVHQGYIWEKHYKKKTIPVIFEGEYVCSHPQCGKKESFHDLESVPGRKNHVFRRLELPVEDECVYTHTYRKKCTIERFVADQCAFNKNINLWAKLYCKGSKGVAEKMAHELNMSSEHDIPRLKTTPGIQSFSDGVLDVVTRKWYPYKCECHHRFDGQNSVEFSLARGYELNSPPRVRRFMTEEGYVDHAFELEFVGDEGNFREYDYVPSDHCPEVCKRCGAGMCPANKVAVLYHDSPVDIARVWDQMMGDELDASMYTCKRCTKPMDHEDHQPGIGFGYANGHPFQPLANDFTKCEACLRLYSEGREDDMPENGFPEEHEIHQPMCRMCFQQPLKATLPHRNHRHHRPFSASVAAPWTSSPSSA